MVNTKIYISLRKVDFLYLYLESCKRTLVLMSLMWQRQQEGEKVKTKHIPQHISVLCCARGRLGEFQSGLYLQITEIVGAIVNLVDGELKNVTPSALQWNAALSPIRVRSRWKA